MDADHNMFNDDNPTYLEEKLRVVAIILAILFYIGFPLLLEIESAGGWDSWTQDTDGLIAHILLLIAHFVLP